MTPRHGVRQPQRGLAFQNSASDLVAEKVFDFDIRWLGVVDAFDDEVPSPCFRKNGLGHGAAAGQARRDVAGLAR
jgi:hypothetical protein